MEEGTDAGVVCVNNMGLHDTKNKIVQQIESMNALDFSKLYSKGVSVVPWSDYTSQEVELFVNEILGVLNNLKENVNLLDSVPSEQIKTLTQYLEQVVSTYNSSLVNLNPAQITTHHFNVLNYLNSTNNLLRSTGLFMQLKLLPNYEDTLSKLKEANNEIKTFKLDDFRKAIGLVDDLIAKKVSFEDKTIREHLGSFIKSAEDHKIKRDEKFLSQKFSGQWWWLFGAVVMGVIVADIVFSFIGVLENSLNISSGVAILRISSLIIPSYFMIFFLSQFTYHKRMYEIYNFKNTALNTMTELMKVNPGKADYILEQGLNVLFNEPQVKEAGKYDKQLVSELLGMLKNQINK